MYAFKCFSQCASKLLKAARKTHITIYMLPMLLLFCRARGLLFSISVAVSVSISVLVGFLEQCLSAKLSAVLSSQFSGSQFSILSSLGLWGCGALGLLDNFATRLFWWLPVAHFRYIRQPAVAVAAKAHTHCV